tara:strand:+ start:403 stop:576 length:174 start_codon:yes stop_codon:yes gene_type:complete
MNLENNMVVGPDDFDKVVECEHQGELSVEYFGMPSVNTVRIRCVDCDTIFEGVIYSK